MSARPPRDELDRVTVQFDDAGFRTPDLDAVREHDLSRPVGAAGDR